MYAIEKEPIVGNGFIRSAMVDTNTRIMERINPFHTLNKIFILFNYICYICLSF